MFERKLFILSIVFLTLILYLSPEFDTTEVFRAKFLKSDPLLSRVSGFGTEEKSKKA